MSILRGVLQLLQTYRPMKFRRTHRVFPQPVRAFMLGTRPQLRKRNGLNANLYPTADAILKIGRYIAITINPITTPKNTIIAGSSSAVNEATA